MIGQVLKKRYELLQELGRSAFAVTHLAHDRERDRRCVVKLLSLRRADGPKVHELFEREALVLARLEHPRIPGFVDFFTEETGDDLLVALVQDHVAGRDLFRLVQSGRRFTERQVVEIGIALAGVLEYLHAFEPPILHRDLKPSNVLLAEDGTPWLVDFGSVRDKARQDPLLVPGGPTVVGTFGYMPIEQAQGQAVAASDVSSLAATLVYLLSRREPWELEKRGLGLELRGALQVSPRLLLALERALEPDWRRRTPTARAFREALEGVLRPQQRSPVVALAAAGVVGLALAVVIVGKREQPPAPVAISAAETAPASPAALPAGVRQLGVPVFHHGGPVRAAQFLPGDQDLVTAGDDATLSVWSLPRGGERWRLRLGGAARALAVSRGSVPRIAVATASRSPLWLLDVDGGTVARLAIPNDMPFHALAWDLAFDARGETLATAAVSGRVDLWSAADGTHRATARPCATAAETQLAALPGGGFVVACEARSLVLLGDDLAERRRVPRGEAASDLLSMPDPDVVGLLARHRTFVTFDLANGVPRRAPEVRFPEGLESAALSPDGRLLALGLSTGAAVVVELASGRRLHAFEGHSGPVYSVAFSADGTRLATASGDHRASVWSLTGGSLFSPPGLPVAGPGGVTALAFAPGGDTLYAATGLGQLRQWSLAGVLAREHNLGGPVFELGFFGEGQLMAAIGTPSRVEEAARRLVLHDPGGQRTRELVLPADARGLALFGTHGAITGSATRLDRWDLSTGLRTSWPVPLAERPVAASTDGHALATLREPAIARGRHQLVLRDGRSGAELKSPAQREGGPFPVACSGARADHVLYDGRLWSVVGGPEPSLVALGTAFGNACAVSPDGRWLALRERVWGTGGTEAGDHVLLHAIPRPPLKEVRPLTLAARLGGHRGPVGALAFSFDSRTLATGGADGSVMLWDLDAIVSEVERGQGRTWPAEPGRAEAVWAFADDQGRVRLPADARGHAFERGVVGDAFVTELGLELEGPQRPVTAGEWTLAGWFRLGGLPVSRPLQPVLGSPFVSLDVRAGQPLLFFHFATGGHASLGLQEWSGAWSADAWHHVAVVKARGGTTRVCVDAVCGAGPSSAAFADPIGPIHLGPRPGQSADRVGIDELRLYARALSDSELAAEARASHLRPLPTPLPTPRPAGAPLLEATPEPVLLTDVSPLVAREPRAEFDVLRFAGPLSLLELFDVEIGGGRVWVGSSRGLLEHDPRKGTWRLHGKAAGLPGERLFQIAWVDGRVVVDSVEITAAGNATPRGTHVFDPATDRFSAVDLGASGWHLSGEGSQVWIGRSDGAELRSLPARGAALLESVGSRAFTRANGALQHDAVHRIELRPDSVWFASMGSWQERRAPTAGKAGDGFFVGGGVSSWDRVSHRFQRWGVEAGLADGYCSGIAVDDSEAWVTHFREERGVSRLDRSTGRWQAFHTGSNGLKLGGISVALSRQHAWIGSQHGLIQVDRRTLVARRFDHEQRLPGHLLYGMSEGLGALWVTVHGTANREPEGWRTQAGLLRIPLP